jgi:hypothetical protein
MRDGLLQNFGKDVCDSSPRREVTATNPPPPAEAKYRWTREVDPLVQREVTLVSKKGCHLCENIVDALERLSRTQGFRVKVIDIGSDKELHDMYWDTIPVVVMDGKVVLDVRSMGPGVDYEKRLGLLLAR